MFELRPTEDVIRIAACGGGFSFDASMRPTDDLIRIAAAASGKGARVRFVGLSMRPTEDLIRIASAGKGCVEFTD
jgi:DNA replication protein